MGDFINKLKNGFNEFWSGLEKGQRIRILIAALLSFILVISFVIYASRPQMEILYSNLGQADAGMVFSRLKEMNVNTRIEGTTIYVPREQIDELRAQLAVEGLLGEDSTYPEESQGSFYETSDEKNQRYLIAKQNKLKKGLKAIKGVDYADVNLYIPEDQTFIIDQNTNESTASLIIKMKSGYPPLDRNQVNGIVQYIARSVKGLQPENVSIIDENGRSLVPDAGTPNALISSQMEMQETVKNNIEKSITKFLEAPFGANNVKVTAAVKLDFNSVTQNITTYKAPDDEKNAGIVRNMQDIKKEWVDAAQGGVPGTDTNIDINQYAEVDESKAQYNEASTVVNYEINEIKEQIVKEMGNIQSLSVSVLINENNLNEEALADTEELTVKVKELVDYTIQGFNYEVSQNADGTDKDAVKVALMKFDTTLEDEIKSAQEEEARDRRRELYIMIGTAVAAVLVFAAALFLLLRKKLGSSDSDGYVKDSSGRSIPAGMIPDNPVAEIDLDDKNEVKKKIEKFVGLKPEAVAQLLKTWLNEE
ncbi:MAG: flagellar basal-body MS-ring/collar protein FliF [Clostridiaceae bacterium]|nr:flagellar basal-body MS-ring/collar protein FliF [Clostridiaceae bacterium]